jgi:hypothetical protein
MGREEAISRLIGLNSQVMQPAIVTQQQHSSQPPSMIP